MSSRRNSIAESPWPRESICKKEVRRLCQRIMAFSFSLTTAYESSSYIHDFSELYIAANNYFQLHINVKTSHGGFSNSSTLHSLRQNCHRQSRYVLELHSKLKQCCR